MKRFIALCFFYSTVMFRLFPRSVSGMQLFPASHWIYGAMESVASDVGAVLPWGSVPASAGELRTWFYGIDREGLSDPVMRIYDEIDSFLRSDHDGVPGAGAFRFSGNIILNPEFYWKSNPEIPWSFRYFMSDNLATAPLLFGFSDCLMIETDIFLGKNFASMQAPGNFTNIPYRTDQLEFLFPRFAYASAGKIFGGWGFNLCVGKEGMQIGNTGRASILYDSTFETDAYVRMSVFSRFFRYSLGTVQIDRAKYLYLHQADINPLPCLRLSLVEGSLVNAPFEIRFLNPLMVMHQFSAWTEYNTEEENRWYDEGHFCAYLGFTFDWSAARNLRIYGLYAQNELQTIGERSTEKGRSYPDSMGAQLGAEFSLPSGAGLWKFRIEGVYTSPWLYIKTSPDWSLYRARRDNMNSAANPVCTWIGRFGPDCAGFIAGAEYSECRLWSFSAEYMLIAHGSTDFGIFSGRNDDGIWTYYPTVRYNMAESDDGRAAAVALARDMGLSGTVEFRNSVVLRCSRRFGEHLELNAETAASVIFNCGNVRDNLQCGIEIGAGIKYNVL
mgnify:FL=1